MAEDRDLSGLYDIVRAKADSVLDVCKLLTKAEAEVVLGESVRDPQPGTLGAAKFCDYKTVKIYGGIVPYSIHIPLVRETKEIWDAGNKVHAQGKELRPVTGLGEDAYFLLDDLEIFSKQHLLTINVLKNVDKPNHAKAVEQAERQIAQKVLPRLP